jgi:RepB DNA-primase from phage plasmid/CHC2 zinc finger
VIETYLDLIAGPARDGYIEVRWKLPGGGMGREFFPVGDRPIGERLAAKGAETEVYIGAAVRARRDGGKTGIDRLHLLWVDLDTPEAVDHLASFDPPPTMVVWSGSGGAHSYWRLTNPVTVGDGERANRRLAVHLGADPRAVDAARILRPPGTLNHKHQPPVPVTLDRWRGGDYTARQVAGDLADSEPEQPKGTPGRPFELGPNDPLSSIPPEVYVEALAGEPVGRGRKIRCPFHGDTDPSLHVYETAGEGWYCYGCGRGGTVIDFAAAVFGIEPRGRGYWRLRDRIVERLLHAPLRAA